MPSPPCNDQRAVAAATALPRNFVLLDCFSGSIAGPSSRVILRSLRQPACARLPSQQRPQNESQPATRPCRLQAHAGSLPQVIRDSSLRLAVVWALGAIRLLIPAIQALQPAATHVWRARPHPRPRGPRAPLAAIVDPVHLVRHPPHHRHEHLDALQEKEATGWVGRHGSTAAGFCTRVWRVSSLRASIGPATLSRRERHQAQRRAPLASCTRSSCCSTP